jgi:hypothetical protein
LPLASPLQEAGLENLVPGKGAARTDSPPVLPALTFPDVLGDLVETSEPATPLKEDAGPKETKPAAAGRSLLGAATRGFVRNSQLRQGEPPAAALPESLWSPPPKLSPAPALLDGLSTAASTQAAAPDGYSATRNKVTAPEGPYRSAKGSNVSGGLQATAGPTPGEEDEPSLLDPAAALAGGSTAPEPLPAPRQKRAFETPPATPGAAQPSRLASVAPGARSDAKANPETAWFEQPSATLHAPETPSATVEAAVPNGPAKPTARSRTAMGEDPPSPDVPALSAAAPSSSAPASLGQAAPEQRLFAATANRALFQAATAESTRHSAATAIQPPLPTGALEPARYGAPDPWEPAAQSGGGKAAELAFGARLVPTAEPVAAPAIDQPDPLPLPVAAPARPRVTAPLDSAVPEPAGAAAATPLEPAIGQTDDSAEEISSLPASLEKGDAGAAERFRKSETPAPSPGETSSAASAARLSPDTAYAPAVRLADASNQPEHSAAAEPRPAAAPETSAGAEPSKPPAAARNIQLDVNGGNGRVEVRLTERGGEVEVAVRTPDARLAGALREDLPALSSRLAESGFRAETWHPASPRASSGVPSGPGDWHKLTEPSPAGTTSQDRNGRSRQNGGQPNGDSQPRQPQTQEQQPNRKDQGKDFAWLMSSLR